MRDAEENLRRRILRIVLAAERKGCIARTYVIVALETAVASILTGDQNQVQVKTHNESWYLVTGVPIDHARAIVIIAVELRIAASMFVGLGGGGGGGGVGGRWW